MHCDYSVKTSHVTGGLIWSSHVFEMRGWGLRGRETQIVREQLTVEAFDPW